MVLGLGIIYFGVALPPIGIFIGAAIGATALACAGVVAYKAISGIMYANKVNAQVKKDNIANTEQETSEKTIENKTSIPTISVKNNIENNSPSRRNSADSNIVKI